MAAVQAVEKEELRIHVVARRFGCCVIWAHNLSSIQSAVLGLGAGSPLTNPQVYVDRPGRWTWAGTLECPRGGGDSSSVELVESSAGGGEYPVSVNTSSLSAAVRNMLT